MQHAAIQGHAFGSVEVAVPRYCPPGAAQSQPQTPGLPQLAALMLHTTASNEERTSPIADSRSAFIATSIHERRHRVYNVVASRGGVLTQIAPNRAVPCALGVGHDLS
jgi:hypothetical protein